VKRPTKGNRRASPSEPTAGGGSRVTTFAMQLVSHIQESQKTQGSDLNVSAPRGTLSDEKGYSCEASHKMEHILISPASL